jgi:hypothetical protein
LITILNERIPGEVCANKTMPVFVQMKPYSGGRRKRGEDSPENRSSNGWNIARELEVPEEGFLVGEGYENGESDDLILNQ